ncbi:MAG: hypothetical protein PHX74_10075 [Candidatus Sumerlaeales bacterium]|nr:hypothetical protein [Candidatus Sumerlaeales bacterium]
MTPIRFSNSYTAVHNALLPIELAPIASVKTQTTAASGKLTASSQWLHYNHIGNVMGTTNANGAWTATYMDAFGNPLTAATVNSSGAFGSMTLGSRGITGKAYDPRANAYYFYQRWYDPKLGAFTSQDPNPPHQQLPYMFVDGNPIMAVDLDGSVVNYVNLGYINPLPITPMPYNILLIVPPTWKSPYSIYGEENKKRPDGSGGVDKLNHCIVSCRMVRETFLGLPGSGRLTFAIGIGKEVFDGISKFIHLKPNGFDEADLTADRTGILADPSKSCEDACKGIWGCPQ